MMIIYFQCYLRLHVQIGGFGFSFYALHQRMDFFRAQILSQSCNILVNTKSIAFGLAWTMPVAFCQQSRRALFAYLQVCCFCEFGLLHFFV